MMTSRLLKAFLLCFSPAIAIAQPCTLTPSASVLTTPLCSGKPVQFTATNIPGATYAWTPPTGAVTFTDPTDRNAVVPSMPGAGGTGIYTVTITDGGCVYNIPVNITTIDLTPSKPVITQNGPMCPGLDDNLFASTTGAPGVVYTWAFPGDPNPHVGQTQDRDDVDAGMVGIYTVVASTLSGCKSDATSFLFKVHPDVQADFDFSIDLDCKEDRVAFRSQSTGANKYSWTFGDGFGSPDYAPMHAYTVQPANYFVRLIAANDFCKDTIEKQVSLNHPLAADFSVSDDSICQNTVINFTNATSLSVGGPHTYYWQFRDGSAELNTDNAAHTYKNVGLYQARLIVKDYLGCYDTAIHEILVDSAGFAEFTVSNSNLCAGRSIELAGVYSPVGNTGVSWDMADGIVLTSKTAFPYAYDVAGTYPINFKASYRICPEISITKNVVIKALPKIDLGPDTSICPGGRPYVVRDNINEGNKNATWAWNTRDRNVKPAYTISAPGIYRAEVTIDGCTGSDEVVVNRSCYIDLPNAFTPNGDGTGDYFLPRQMLSSNLSGFNMTIYNRWGGVVFQTNNINGRGWDGRFNGVQQPIGVYTYLIQAKFNNNNTENYSGNITLLR